MSAITIEIPAIILESHRYDLARVKAEAQWGLVVWEYLSGRLSLKECGNLLQVGYRGFLELLWSKGIPVDALNERELAQQVDSLRKMLSA